MIIRDWGIIESTGFERIIHRIRDLTKNWCRIRDLTALRKWDSPKLGTGCRIAIKKRKWDSGFS